MPAPTALRVRRSRLIVALALPLLLLLSAAPVRAAEVEVVATFDEAAGQNPEGLAIDSQGNTFVSMSALGELWRFPAGSTTPEVFGTISGIVPGLDFGLLGLAADARGDIYGAVQPARHAVRHRLAPGRDLAHPAGRRGRGLAAR
jgi:hypothetical protein